MIFIQPKNSDICLLYVRERKEKLFRENHSHLFIWKMVAKLMSLMMIIIHIYTYDHTYKIAHAQNIIYIFNTNARSTSINTNSNHCEKHVSFHT